MIFAFYSIHGSGRLIFHLFFCTSFSFLFFWRSWSHISASTLPCVGFTGFAGKRGRRKWRKHFYHQSVTETDICSFSSSLQAIHIVLCRKNISFHYPLQVKLTYFFQHLIIIYCGVTIDEWYLLIIVAHKSKRDSTRL